MLLPLLLGLAFQEKTLAPIRYDMSGWKMIASEGVTGKLGTVAGKSTAPALEIDYDYNKHSGFVIAEKRIDLDLPENYAFTFWVKAESPNNNLEFKLSDNSGDNVWWVNRVNFEFPSAWQKITVRKRNIQFAWGPQGGGEIKHAATLQFAVSAYSGGKGKVFIDDLEFRPLDPVRPYTVKPFITASSSSAGTKPQSLFEPGQGKWQTQTAKDEWLHVDFLRNREFGGLVIDWLPGESATDYTVETSVDGKTWDMAADIHGAGSGKQYLPMPDSEVRFVHFTFKRARGGYVGIRSIAVKDVAFGASMNNLIEARAKDARRGLFPRAFLNEENYWTIFGMNGGVHEALMSEDGQVEVDKGSYTLEPFLYLNGKLLTWQDVEREQDLPDNLPLPRVTWRSKFVDLEIWGVNDARDDNRALVRYTVKRHPGAPTVKGSLFVAVRPFQVNPPWQNLKMNGGATKIAALATTANDAVINGKTGIRFAERAMRYGATSFSGGDIVDFIGNGSLPTPTTAIDSYGTASAGFRFDFNSSRPCQVHAVIERSLTGGRQALTPEKAIQEAVSGWRQTLDIASNIKVSGPAKRYMDVARANLAYILVNRDGPTLQPGSRTYERGWIRDGALMATALLQMGRAKEAREFVEWYAPFQFPSGAVPCVVDQRGADPVPENDSHGELIFATREVYRFTNDKAFLRRMYPYIQKAVGYIQTLRAQCMTDDYRNGSDPVKRACYGLVPESISHEGYSAKPMHSYWDDFFTLKGLKDAVEIAQVLGEARDLGEWSATRDDFHKCLYASIALAQKNTKVDYIPGCVELGDFDATSTSIAIYPCDELANLPKDGLKATYDKYWDFFSKRASGQKKWFDYTPYEIRNCNAYLLMGQVEKVHQMVKFFMKDLRPSGWGHWAEVVRAEYRKSGFLGDMPHSWVGSEFVKLMRNVYLLERDSDQSLMLLSGIPQDWLPAGASATFTEMPTYFGKISFSVLSKANSVEVKINKGSVVPKGGIWVRNPFAGFGKLEHVTAVPATLVFRRH